MYKEQAFAYTEVEEGTYVLKMIMQSIERRQIVEMIYVDGNGRMTKRRVKIFKANSDSFTAYCFLRKSTRKFKLDHVLALVPVENVRKVI